MPDPIGPTVDERELLLVVADAARRLADATVICGDPDASKAYEHLKSAITNLDQWQTTANEVSSVDARTKPCEVCGATIFFAERPGGSWMPVELGTVPADDMLPAWRYVVDFSGMAAGRGNPTVRARPTKAKGEVWVNHQDVCGGGDGPKHKVASLVRRWKVNAERAEVTMSLAMDSLRELRGRLSDSHPPSADT